MAEEKSVILVALALLLIGGVFYNMDPSLTGRAYADQEAQMADSNDQDSAAVYAQQDDQAYLVVQQEDAQRKEMALNLLQQRAAEFGRPIGTSQPLDEFYMHVLVMTGAMPVPEGTTFADLNLRAINNIISVIDNMIAQQQAGSQVVTSTGDEPVIIDTTQDQPIPEEQVVTIIVDGEQTNVDSEVVIDIISTSDNLEQLIQDGTVIIDQETGQPEIAQGTIITVTDDGAIQITTSAGQSTVIESSTATARIEQEVARERIERATGINLDSYSLSFGKRYDVITGISDGPSRSTLSLSARSGTVREERGFAESIKVVFEFIFKPFSGLIDGKEEPPKEDASDGCRKINQPGIGLFATLSVGDGDGNDATRGGALLDGQGFGLGDLLGKDDDTPPPGDVYYWDTCRDDGCEEKGPNWQCEPLTCTCVKYEFPRPTGNLGDSCASGNVDVTYNGDAWGEECAAVGSDANLRTPAEKKASEECASQVKSQFDAAALNCNDLCKEKNNGKKDAAGNPLACPPSPSDTLPQCKETGATYTYKNAQGQYVSYNDDAKSACFKSHYQTPSTTGSEIECNCGGAGSEDDGEKEGKPPEKPPENPPALACNSDKAISTASEDGYAFGYGKTKTEAEKNAYATAKEKCEALIDDEAQKAKTSCTSYCDKPVASDKNKACAGDVSGALKCDPMIPAAKEEDYTCDEPGGSCVPPDVKPFATPVNPGVKWPDGKYHFKAWASDGKAILNAGELTCKCGSGVGSVTSEIGPMPVIPVAVSPTGTPVDKGGCYDLPGTSAKYKNSEGKEYTAPLCSSNADACPSGSKCSPTFDDPTCKCRSTVVPVVTSSSVACTWKVKLYGNRGCTNCGKFLTAILGKKVEYTGGAAGTTYTNPITSSSKSFKSRQISDVTVINDDYMPDDVNTAFRAKGCKILPFIFFDGKPDGTQCPDKYICGYPFKSDGTLNLKAW